MSKQSDLMWLAAAIACLSISLATLVLRMGWV